MRDPDLRTILSSGRWLIFGSVGLGLLLALLSVRLTDRTYEATAPLVVHPAPGTDGQPLDSPQALAETYAALLVDPGFLIAVSGRVRPLDGHRRSAHELRDAIRAEAVPGAELVLLRAEGPSPQDARDLANDVANAFVISIRQETQQHAAQVHDDLRARLNRIGRLLRKRDDPDLVAERVALVQQDARLTLVAAEQSLVVTASRPASASSDPIRPQPLLSVLAGLLLGLVCGVGLAWIRAVLLPERAAAARERIAARPVRQ